MSVVSENVNAPEIDLRHRCVSCGESLIGRPIVAGGDGNYCVLCAQTLLWGPPAKRPIVVQVH